mmetsp:Transcript_10607/g.33760  ORF Transcript_10607/g.33760 Transcript_10607/m.33760 type:complete len:277 (+) Transcript_10607:2226-3056(+)
MHCLQALKPVARPLVQICRHLKHLPHCLVIELHENRAKLAQGKERKQLGEVLLVPLECQRHRSRRLSHWILELAKIVILFVVLTERFAPCTRSTTTEPPSCSCTGTRPCSCASIHTCCPHGVLAKHYCLRPQRQHMRNVVHRIFVHRCPCTTYTGERSCTVAPKCCAITAQCSHNLVAQASDGAKAASHLDRHRAPMGMILGLWLVHDHRCELEVLLHCLLRRCPGCNSCASEAKLGDGRQGRVREEGAQELNDGDLVGWIRTGSVVERDQLLNHW